jgi:hypothetical protein
VQVGEQVGPGRANEGLGEGNEESSRQGPGKEGVKGGGGGWTVAGEFLSCDPWGWVATERNGGDCGGRGSTAIGAAREILLARLSQMWQDVRETMKTPCPKAHRPAETHLQTESPLSSASA